MSRSKTILFICLVTASILFLNGCSKTKYPTTIGMTPITYVDKDTVHTFTILRDNTLNPHEDRMYSYFHSQSIGTAMGGYMGSVLHGAYTKYSRPNYLLEKGTFKKGLKSGAWRSWYKSGVIKKKTTWDRGQISREEFTYYPNGSLKRKTKYKRGLLHGKSFHYTDNGLLLEKVTYKKGQISKKSFREKDLTESPSPNKRNWKIKWPRQKPDSLNTDTKKIAVPKREAVKSDTIKKPEVIKKSAAPPRSKKSEEEETTEEEVIE